jgi:hypothetical protein
MRRAEPISQLEDLVQAPAVAELLVLGPDPLSRDPLRVEECLAEGGERAMGFQSGIEHAPDEGAGLAKPGNRRPHLETPGRSGELAEAGDRDRRKRFGERHDAGRRRRGHELEGLVIRRRRKSSRKHPVR